MNSLSNIIENIDDISEVRKKEFAERMRGVPFLEVMNSMMEPYVEKEILDEHINQILTPKKGTDIDEAIKKCMSLKARKIEDFAWEFVHINAPTFELQEGKRPEDEVIFLFFVKLFRLETRIERLEKQGENVLNHKNQIDSLRTSLQNFATNRILNEFFNETIRKVMSRQENAQQRIAVKKNKDTEKRIAIELQMIEDSLDNFFERKEKSEQKKIIQEQKRLEREKYATQAKMRAEQKENRNEKNISQADIDEFSRIERKMQQFQYRLLKILEEENFTNKTKKEVDDMEKNLQKLLKRGSVDENHEVVPVVFDFIESVRTNIREVERKKPSHSKVFLEKNSKRPSIPLDKSILVQQAFPKNREMISWINQALSYFSYRISSTILKTESYGDGSFVMQTLRPFLRYVGGEIFEKDLILFNKSLSWSQILEQYAKKIDDASQ